jgi:hypothetical protein
MQMSKYLRSLLPLLGMACLGQAAATGFVPIDVESELNALDVEVFSNNIGAQVTIGIQNKEQFKVYCNALFNNGPQTPVERRAEIKAEGSGQMTAPLFRQATRVRVRLVCDKQPIQRQQEEPPAEKQAAQ